MEGRREEVRQGEGKDGGWLDPLPPPSLSPLLRKLGREKKGGAGGRAVGGGETLPTYPLAEWRAGPGGREGGPAGGRGGLASLSNARGAVPLPPPLHCPPEPGVQGGGCAWRASGVALRSPCLWPPGAEWSRQVNEQGGGGTARPRTLSAPAARAQRARLGSGIGLAAAAAPPPTCWRRGAGAWGQPHSSQLPFRLLQRSETRPTSASSLSTYPTATFKLSLKTWGAPRRFGASPRGSSQPGEGARKKDLGGAGGRGDAGRGSRDPRDPSPPAQAIARPASEQIHTTPSSEALHLVGARAMPVPKAREAGGRKK